MDIKEIALKVAQATNLHYIVTSEKHTNDDWNIRFAEALISAYKENLLKEVGEPVAVTNHAQLGYVTDGMHPDIPLAMWAKETSYSGANIALYTSDQVAAAILKATEPLEDQLAKAEQLWQVAEQLWQIAQGRCDGLEEKLAKAEQRVAELIPGNGKELSERMKRLATNSVWRYSADQNKPVDMSDPNIQELFAIIDHLCIGIDSPANGASS